MQRIVTRSALILSLTCAALAQTPSFEVATIKPATPPATSMGPGGGMRIAMRMGVRGGPGTSDPGQIQYSGMSLKDLLVTAYGVKTYQVTGPNWMESERFDVVAKVPPGAGKDDVNRMLQNLLAERFKLTLHREKKDLPMYALVVARNGPKLKESPPDDPNAAANMRNMSKGGDMPPPPPGGGRGMTMMMMNGRARMSNSRQTMAQFAEWLVRQLDRPVTDETGLTKQYDVTLDYTPESTGRNPMGMALPPPPGGEGGAPAEADAPAAPTLFAALQEQLGLKLEQRKGPVDLLVVDHLEKTPTEN